jgi:hypothetical protein
MAGRGGALWNIQGGSAAWRAGYCQVMARRYCVSCGGAAGGAIWWLASAAFVEQMVLPAKARPGFPLSAASPGMTALAKSLLPSRSCQVALAKSLLPSRSCQIALAKSLLPSRSCQVAPAKSLLPNRRGHRRSAGGGGGGRSCAKPQSAERHPAHHHSPIVRHARLGFGKQSSAAAIPSSRDGNTMGESVSW